MATTNREPVDLKLEVVVIGVSDVDRAKAFYEKLGWRLDGDFRAGGGCTASCKLPRRDRKIALNRTGVGSVMAVDAYCARRCLAPCAARLALSAIVSICMPSL